MKDLNVLLEEGLLVYWIHYIYDVKLCLLSEACGCFFPGKEWKAKQELASYRAPIRYQRKAKVLKEHVKRPIKCLKSVKV